MPSLMEVLVVIAVLVLVFGTSRFGLLKNSFIKAIRAINSSVKGETKE